MDSVPDGRRSQGRRRPSLTWMVLIPNRPATRIAGMPVRAAVAVVIVAGFRRRKPVRPVFIFHTALLQLVAIHRIAIFILSDDLTPVVFRLCRQRHPGQQGRRERGDARYGFFIGSIFISFVCLLLGPGPRGMRGDEEDSARAKTLLFHLPTQLVVNLPRPMFRKTQALPRHVIFAQAYFHPLPFMTLDGGNVVEKQHAIVKDLAFDHALHLQTKCPLLSFP